ncbi:MAG TPA: hypothetical protein VMD25_03135 [Acidobacteriaceae bacterium]|nr:hypothetical protein [Acidobacteriaceae bacterium]
MQLAARLVLIFIVAALAGGGWLLLFRTQAIVAHARRRHPASPAWIQNWPFHRMIFKPWYPAYLRFGGIFAWLLAVCLVSAALLELLR